MIEPAKGQLKWAMPVIAKTPVVFTYFVKPTSQGTIFPARDGEGSSELQSIRASYYMSVELDSGAFDFSPKGPVEKILGEGRSGIWKWTGIPKEEGSHVVNVIVSNRQPDGKGGFIDIPASDPVSYKVIVTAREMKWNETLRFWLTDWNSTAGILTKFVGSLTLLLAAIVGLRTGFRRLMRGEDAPPAAKGTK